MSVTENVILTIAAIIITLFLLKRKVNVGIVALTDSLFFVVLAKVPVTNAILFAFKGAVSSNTIKLILTLYFIMIIENIMRETGSTTALAGSIKELVGNIRIVAGILPAIVGLLPSSGGARFSCPMVDEVIGENSDKSNKAFINYWFRHIWLDGFILYPGPILASGLLGISVFSFFVHLLPFMLISILLGTCFGLLPVINKDISPTRPFIENLNTFAASILPVIIVIVLYIFLLKYTAYSLEIVPGSMALALFISNKYTIEQVKNTLKTAFPVKLVLIIICVMAFKEILSDSQVINRLPGLLKANNIPIRILFLLLPFLGGFFSGMPVSYVSLTFPILIPLGLGNDIWLVAIAFTAGAIGGMITPLHLCSVMTAEYFNVSLYKLLVKVAAVEAIILVIISIILYVLKS